jgi:hypothetical protein
MAASGPFAEVRQIEPCLKTECSNWREPAPRVPLAWSQRSYAMPKFVPIIGEDPDLIDFSAPVVPPNMDAHKVMDGLDGSRDRLRP